MYYPNEYETVRIDRESSLETFCRVEGINPHEMLARAYQEAIAATVGNHRTTQKRGDTKEAGPVLRFLLNKLPGRIREQP